MGDIVTSRRAPGIKADRSLAAASGTVMTDCIWSGLETQPDAGPQNCRNGMLRIVSRTTKPGMTISGDPIREAIRDRALASGFDAVGFAEAPLDAQARSGLAECISRGYHGGMGWLTDI